jgi:hypothetical protein
VGYNPHKPGRPSHALDTYWVGNLRLVLDVVVAPGNKSSSAVGRCQTRSASVGFSRTCGFQSQANLPAFSR